MTPAQTSTLAAVRRDFGVDAFEHFGAWLERRTGERLIDLRDAVRAFGDLIDPAALASTAAAVRAQIESGSLPSPPVKRGRPPAPLATARGGQAMLAAAVRATNGKRVAQQLGISRATVYRLARGESMPSPLVRVAIAKAYGFPSNNPWDETERLRQERSARATDALVEHPRNATLSVEPALRAAKERQREAGRLKLKPDSAEAKAPQAAASTNLFDTEFSAAKQASSQAN